MEYGNLDPKMCITERAKFTYETYQRCAGKDSRPWEALTDKEHDAWATVVFAIIDKIASQEW